MRLEQLKEILSEASQVFVLTDENVAQYWLPELEHWLGCEQAVEIIVKPGEKYKTLRTAQKVWRALLRHNADRDAILVNMGGGTVTDLGGSLPPATNGASASSTCPQRFWPWSMQLLAERTGLISGIARTR